MSNRVPSTAWVGGPNLDSEMQKLAVVYHQDFALCRDVFPDFESAARAFVNGLALEERNRLKQELVEFVARNPDDASSANAWRQIGPHWMPPTAGLRAEFEKIISWL